ncbi:unnamed protein product [Mytilus coruscus]|uniref:Uncharacterized protein n=1 Tax=Mytilus coruscus TaxID=42192 RepID=A0A6J8E4U7_MYTCO|nr:unnamed protein product [Mytilus coruscus]
MDQEDDDLVNINDDDSGIVSVCLESESSTDNGDEIHIDQDFVLGCSSPKKEKRVDNIGRVRPRKYIQKTPQKLNFAKKSYNENSTDYDSSKLEKPGVAQENFNDKLHALEETCYDQTNTKLDSRKLSNEKACEIVEDSVCSGLVEEDESDDDLISDEKWHDLMKIEEEQEDSYDLTEQGNDQITNSRETLKKSKGIEYEIGGCKVVTQAFLICGTADLPAKSLVLNCNQFNGQYSCMRCVHPGETYKTAAGGSVHVFPYDASKSMYEERTSSNCLEDAAIATETVIGELACTGLSIIHPTFLSVDVPHINIEQKTNNVHLVDVTKIFNVVVFIDIFGDDGKKFLCDFQNVKESD